MAAVALIANSRSPGKPALPTTKTKHGAMPQFGSASHHTDLRSSDLHSCWPGLEFAQKMHSSKTRFGNRSRRVPKNKRSRLPGYLKRAGRLSGLAGQMSSGDENRFAHLLRQYCAESLR